MRCPHCNEPFFSWEFITKDPVSGVLIHTFTIEDGKLVCTPHLPPDPKGNVTIAVSFGQ